MADERIIKQSPFPAVAEVPPPAIEETVHYPDSDGHFLPDNPLQADAIVNVRASLKQHFAKTDRVVLEGDMFIYHEEGNPRESIAPDIFVVRDHDLGDRRVYKLWEEGKPPHFALEVISPESKVRNEVDKRDLYERLGILEYFLFQPDPQQRGRRLVGYRLRGRSYREVEPEATGELRSLVLEVEFRVEGRHLRLQNVKSRKDYCWPEEFPEKLEVAEAKAAFEAEGRRQAEAKAASEAEGRREAEAKAAEAAARIAELEARLRQEGP